jgi:hypothetical protein
MTDLEVEFDPALDEPPLLTFVRDYWHSRRGAAAMPRRKDITPSHMKAHLRHVLLVDVVARGEDFRYRLVGSELQRYFHGNPSGKLMSEALAPFGAETVRRTIATYRAVIERRTPLRIRGAGSLYAQDAKLFDALLAPLSDDVGMPVMILGTFTFIWNFDTALTGPRIIEPNEDALAQALSGPR